MTIFLVTKGTYSDFKVVCACSTRDVADIRISELNARRSSGTKLFAGEMELYGDEPQIMELELDAPLELNAGAYEASITEDGTATTVTWEDDGSADTPASREESKVGMVWFIGWGTTRELARRSAEEYRRVYLSTLRCWQHD